jgi:hypothetical protein
MNSDSTSLYKAAEETERRGFMSSLKLAAKTVANITDSSEQFTIFVASKKECVSAKGARSKAEMRRDARVSACPMTEPQHRNRLLLLGHVNSLSHPNAGVASSSA